MNETRTALVIGAAGTFGAHATQSLLKRGWRIRALARNPAAAAARLGAKTPIEWRAGDAMLPESVCAAAEGVQLVVHAANPPAYRNWRGTIVPMAESAIAAARATGARLALPGTVYNFAPGMGAQIAEDASQTPITRKGAIRVALERRLRQASEEEGVKVLILRSGDFFGPASPNSALGFLLRRRGQRLVGLWSPGPDEVGHAWAYTPDLAEAFARLVEREDDLGPYAVFHFRGCWLEHNSDLATAVRRVVGRPGLPVRRFPWALVDVAAPFNETMREMKEMRYLWDRPIGLDNSRLVGFLGDEPHTPLDAALRATLADMGLLEDQVALEPGLNCRPAAQAA